MTVETRPTSPKKKRGSIPILKKGKSRRFSTVGLSQKISRLLSSRVTQGQIDSEKLSLLKEKVPSIKSQSYSLWIKNMKLEKTKLKDLHHSLEMLQAHVFRYNRKGRENDRRGSIGMMDNSFQRQIYYRNSKSFDMKNELKGVISRLDVFAEDEKAFLSSADGHDSDHLSSIKEQGENTSSMQLEETSSESSQDIDSFNKKKNFGRRKSIMTDFEKKEKIGNYQRTSDFINEKIISNLDLIVSSKENDDKKNGLDKMGKNEGRSLSYQDELCDPGDNCIKDQGKRDNCKKDQDQEENSQKNLKNQIENLNDKNNLVHKIVPSHTKKESSFRKEFINNLKRNKKAEDFYNKRDKKDIENYEDKKNKEEKEDNEDKEDKEDNQLIAKNTKMDELFKEVEPYLKNNNISKPSKFKFDASTEITEKIKDKDSLLDTNTENFQKEENKANKQINQEINDYYQEKNTASIEECSFESESEELCSSLSNEPKIKKNNENDENSKDYKFGKNGKENIENDISNGQKSIKENIEDSIPNDKEITKDNIQENIDDDNSLNNNLEEEKILSTQETKKENPIFGNKIYKKSGFSKYKKEKKSLTVENFENIKKNRKAFKTSLPEIELGLKFNIKKSSIEKLPDINKDLVIDENSSNNFEKELKSLEPEKNKNNNKQILTNSENSQNPEKLEIKITSESNKKNIEVKNLSIISDDNNKRNLDLDLNFLSKTSSHHTNKKLLQEPQRANTPQLKSSKSGLDYDQINKNMDNQISPDDQIISKAYQFINNDNFKILDEFMRKFESKRKSYDKEDKNSPRKDKVNEDNLFEISLNNLRRSKSDTNLSGSSNLANYKNLHLGTMGVWDFDFLGLIGSGGFGKVWMVRRKQTKDYYAMKVLNFKGKNKNFIKDTLNEKKIMQNLVGDYVVKALFSFLHENYYCIVMELM